MNKCASHSFGYFHRVVVLCALTGCIAPRGVGVEVPSDREILIDGKGDGASARIPAFGGRDATRRKPEAIIANTVFALLGTAPAGAVASIPMSLEQSTHHPFGDGQSNAHAEFGSYVGADAPVAALLSPTANGASVRFVFGRELTINNPELEVDAPSATGRVRHTPAITTSFGQRSSSFEISADDRNAWTRSRTFIRARPRGWTDWFVFRFDHPTTTARSLVESMPASLRTFANGRTFPDPEQIESRAAGQPPHTVLTSYTPGPGFVRAPDAANVHGVIPHQGQANEVTAVGGVKTWLALPPAAPIKSLYTCFDARNVQAEETHGVPSGAGWHVIGDPAESLVNSIEGESILVGWSEPDLSASPDAGTGGAVAYGLHSPAAFRFLAPDEAFVSRRGAAHWYAVHHARPVCTEVWVHPCVPFAPTTFSCVAPASVDIRATAMTALGETIVVVGDHAALGAWNPAFGVRLSATSYPVWTGSIALPPGTRVELKLVKVNADGAAIWESGANRGYVVPDDGSPLRMDLVFRG